MRDAPQAVRVGRTPNGTLAYLIGRAASELPPVYGRDLDAAWDAAHHAALRAEPGEPRLFRFAPEDGDPTDLLLADRDARCWAAATEQVSGLRTLHGISVCIRLLALVDAMARLPSLPGPPLHPALARAAAALPLTDGACFDEATLCARLGRLAPLSRSGRTHASGASA